MIYFKKIATMCCILLCVAFFISFLIEKQFYIHNEDMTIQEIKMTKIFSKASIAVQDSVETVILQDIISKLKSYTFHKKISLDKIMGIPTTTEDITTFFIDIYYDANEQQAHFDRIEFFATEDKRVREVTIYCYEANSKKKYQGKISNEIMQKFLEDMEVYI